MGREYLAYAAEIAVIDDHKIFLDGISLLIESIDDNYSVVPFSSPLEILREIEGGRRFDLLICDLIMSSMNGLAFVSALRSHSKTTPILMLSGINTAPPIEDVKRLGGNGFVHKSAENSILQKAIETVLGGGNYFEDGMGDCLIESPSNAFDTDDVDMRDKTIPTLAPRQIEVLQLIANGATNKDIADSLSISENTVKSHLKQIFYALGVNKRTACMRKAQMLGLI